MLVSYKLYKLLKSSLRLGLKDSGLLRKLSDFQVEVAVTLLCINTIHTTAISKVETTPLWKWYKNYLEITL